MNGGTRIIPIEGAEQGASQPDPAADTGSDGGAALCAVGWTDDEEGGEGDPVSDRSWMAPALAIGVILAWTGFFGWAIVVNSNGSDPQQWAVWISQWAMPVLLVLVIVLVAMRTSRREAGRFADVSRSLARESGHLEKRLVGLNTELSLARDFIAAQGRDLESLGRITVDRLSGSAAKLEDMVSQNRQRVELIAEVSSSALDNMDKLKSQLPIIANSAKDLTNNIGNAGRTAHVQLEEMVSGFQRLNDFGLASERQVVSLRERVLASLDQFTRAGEELAQIAESRFETLSAQSAEQAKAAALNEQAALSAWRERTEAHAATLRDALAQLGNDHDALIADSADRLGRFEDAARSLTASLDGQSRSLDEQLAHRRASAEAAAAEQRDALVRQLGDIDSALAERRVAMEQAVSSVAAALATRLADIDRAIDAQRQSQMADAEGLGNKCEEIALKVSALSQILGNVGEEGTKTASKVDTAMVHLNTRLGEMRHALSGTDLQIADLTDSAVRLLELIQAGSDHARTQIPEALRSTEAGLKGLEDRVFTLRDTLREAGDGGRVLAQSVGSAREEITHTFNDLEAVQKNLSDQAAARELHVAGLRAILAEAQQDSEALSAQIELRLTGAIAHLSDAAGKVGEDLRASTAGEIETLAGRLGDESSAAISRVLQGRAAELVGRLEQAIDSAASASRETAVQMRDQLTKVDELAGNLEARVNRVRERAEEQVDNDFARRAALITESLNSSSIDIAKALSSDVSETAWASYLRGDRGIFTRRAVSLLETAEAKAVQAHYEAESEFREHVNRYIHDFETMLRQLLSTRDGNALGVTLLSSDMGKLYVALAQGIERLRT